MSSEESKERSSCVRTKDPEETISLFTLYYRVTYIKESWSQWWLLLLSPPAEDDSYTNQVFLVCL